MIRLTHLRVEVDATPEPGLLRPAIDAALAGRPWPAGPEAVIAHAVAEHVAAQAAEAGTGAGTAAAHQTEPGTRAAQAAEAGTRVQQQTEAR